MPHPQSLARSSLARTLIRLWLVLFAATAGAAQVEVARELEQLMAQYGFEMKAVHLDITRDAMGRAEGADLLPRLRMLLEGFDHVIVQSPAGRVERVIIIGAKVPYTPPAVAAEAPKDPSGEEKPPDGEGEITLETQRIGVSHAVTATLEGDSGRRIQRILLVDTGADYVVLPASLIPQLGVPADRLRAQQVQTANGPVDAQLGTLAALWFEDKRITGVDVAFIADDRLGGNALLGMSILGRFRVTIDDEHNRLVLAGK
jgi:clan AA aspartic protease (TIGR02281 family)